jgi:preprotein translocase subunit YajC
MNFLTFFLWQQPVPPAGNGGYLNMILLVVAMVVIYFMMIRPQSQQRKKQVSFASSLKKGKKVVTIGGIHGVISEINDKTVELIVAPKTHLTFSRDSISMDFSNAAYGHSEPTAADKQQEDNK